MKAARQVGAALRRRPWIVIAAAVALVLGGVVAYAQLAPHTGQAEGSTASPAGGSSASAEYEFVRRDADDPMAVGAVDAPVVLVYWTDMRCPFCAVFSRDTLPVLIEEYVEAGEVRIEFRDVAYFGDPSADAAVAARAAANQGLYVEYLEAVYAVAPESGHPELPRNELIAFAAEIGIPDMARFEADLDDPTLRAAVDQSTANAQQLVVTAVPFFVAGNTALSGAQPTDVFRAFLDDALSKAK